MDVIHKVLPFIALSQICSEIYTGCSWNGHVLICGLRTKRKEGKNFIQICVLERLASTVWPAYTLIQIKIIYISDAITNGPRKGSLLSPSNSCSTHENLPEQELEFFALYNFNALLIMFWYLKWSYRENSSTLVFMFVCSFCLFWSVEHIFKVKPTSESFSLYK